jgi:hypothetical protein
VTFLWNGRITQWGIATLQFSLRNSSQATEIDNEGEVGYEEDKEL